MVSCVDNVSRLCNPLRMEIVSFVIKCFGAVAFYCNLAAGNLNHHCVTYHQKHTQSPWKDAVYTPNNSFWKKERTRCKN